MPSPRLILIDGSAYLFRAFHALPPLSNESGEPTGALFGVVNMLRAHLAQKTEYLAFVIDASGKNFRHEMFPAYKANRPPMPEELRAQIDPMLAIVTALGIPVLRVAGVEADDVIGTLARQAAAAGIEVIVSTGDKDLAQLVDDNVQLVNTMTGQTLDAAGVFAKFGVRPDQIGDYLALMGDKVDNIPGVDKCGEKTAAKWLAEYGSLDAVMANADRVAGKIGENLRAALTQLPLSRDLATVRTALALDVGPLDLITRPADTANLRELYARYGFRAALRDLDLQSPTSAVATADSTTPLKPALAVVAEAIEVPASTPVEKFYETILSTAQLHIWIERLSTATVFAFDTETTGLDAQQAELVGVSFACAPGHAAYVPLAHRAPGTPAQLDLQGTLLALKPLLEDASRPKIGQHGKYDMNVLARYGIDVRGYRYDTMLESYIFNSTATRHDMDSLALRYLGVKTIPFEQVAGKGAKQISFADVGLTEAGEYAAEDADITLRLHQHLRPLLESVPSLCRVFDEIEMPLVPVLARMEREGVLIDAALLRTQTHELRKRMHETIERAHASVGHSFSLDSPKQLQAVLYEELKLPVLAKTPTGQPSTNEDAITDLAEHHELPRLILDYRGFAKLVSTYTERLPEQINPRTGRVHTSFHQAVAATGRLSSTDPNLQNIPIRTEEGRRIRTAFIAPPGYKLVAADYSQIELRIMAHLSADPGLLDAFARGEDVHRATAAEVFAVARDQVSNDQRRAAKAINFGLMYGMSAFGLAKQIGVGRGEAQEYINRYFARYPAVQAYMASVRELARRDGYVETVFGRRLHLREIHSRNPAQRQGAERAAINAPMQGTAADIIKRAMLDVDAWLQGRHDEARLLLQVHDELVLEVREDRVEEVSAGLRERMGRAADLRVPLLVETGSGNNWDEAH
ncbi:MAG: DNA polymerase I [Pseudomonadota bacterium]|nr:DNA polymerase I [Pseudomonadota bacterium]